MQTNVAALRQEYRQRSLNERAAAADPIAQFRTWFDEALAAGVREPNAMTVATASPDGRPSARIMLLKGFDGEGFVFFTNYSSRKGEEMDANPHAALVFWWDVIERQVRVEGTIERVGEAESDEYFQSRPRGSRLGAWASPQSSVIAHREVLEQNVADVMERFGEGDEVPRPPHWGGYRLLPEAVEFWQGRPSRLHDRLLYRRADDGSWTRERLAP